MTPEPVILPFTATVAEALAVVREAGPARRAGGAGLRRAAADVHADRPLPRRSCRSSGCCGSRRARPLEHCVFDEPDAGRARAAPPRRRRAARRLRRAGRARCATGPGGSSARSPSTTSSTTCSRTTGAGPARRDDGAPARGPRRGPREGFRIGVHYDPDAFGRFSEAIARFLGTGRFLVGQTVVVVVWITINVGRRRAPLGPVPVHPPEPGLLHPGRLRRAADPPRPEPPGRPRPGPGRASTARSTPAPRPTPSTSPASWRRCASRWPTS